MRKGVSNAQWYTLGLSAPATCPWLPEDSGLDTHPDSGVKVPLAAIITNTITYHSYASLYNA